jgi:glycosyltransferase involved in cell wall biosynthesis
MTTTPEQRIDDSPTAIDAPVVLHARVVSGHGGGPEKTILNSPRFLATRGYRGLCAYLRPPQDAGFEPIRRRAAEAGATLLEIDDRGAWDLGVVRRMLAVVRQQKVAIWHGHDYKSNALGLLLRRWHPMRLVTTTHGWVKFTRRTPLYYKIDRMCLPRYDRVICVSDDLREECLAAGVAPDCCSLIANAIDTEQFARTLSTQEAKSRLGFSSDRLLIGGMGRLSEEKGFDHLIRAVHRLIEDGAPVDLAIIGDGDQLGPLSRLIDQLGARDHMRLLGYRTDGLDLYQAMDVFALSSLREGLPNVLLEAMATEVPLVATRVAGVPQLVRHDETGLLVEPGDKDALSAALRRLIDDEALRNRLALAARDMVVRDYGFASRMDAVCGVYDELLGDA